MIDARSLQCFRGRSLILWRGQQWSVTNKGVETTDPSVPHVVIPPADMNRIDCIVDGRYSPLLTKNAAWFDADELALMIERARAFHQIGAS